MKRQEIICAFIADLIQNIKERDEYNKTTNIPNNICNMGNWNDEALAKDAIKEGISRTVARFKNYDINNALDFAIAILEDVNAHEEVKALNNAHIKY